MFHHTEAVGYQHGHCHQFTGNTAGVFWCAVKDYGRIGRVAMFSVK
jgi:hypothetical protein